MRLLAVRMHRPCRLENNHQPPASHACRYTSGAAGAPAAAEQRLWEAIDTCLARGGRAYADVAAVCACVAVRESASDLARTLSVLGRRLPAAALKLVQSDAAAALASATGGVLHGAAVLAGEGRRRRQGCCLQGCRAALCRAARERSAV
jgi:hypothetical protein